MLSGAGTWLGNISETEKVCNDLQYFFWRIMLNVPESCPKVGLLCDTKMINMKYRIYKEKCLLLQRIKKLDDKALAKEIHNEAMINNWPCLGSDVKIICEELRIPDINNIEVIKSVINNAIEQKQIKDINAEIDKLSKLQHIKDDNFRNVQDYFHDKNIDIVRSKFKIRMQMVENIPGNFKNMYYGSKALCRFCNIFLTQEHVKECPGRYKLKLDLDMNKLDDLVIYFKRFLEDENNYKKSEKLRS